MESAQTEVQRLESNVAALESEKESLTGKLKSARRSLEGQEKRQLDSDRQMGLFREKRDEEMQALEARLATQETAYKKLSQEFASVSKSNEKVNAALMAKTKEFGKLTDGPHHAVTRVEKNKLMVETVKLKQKRDELFSRFEDMKKELAARELVLRQARTPKVSNLDTQMARVVPHGLALDVTRSSSTVILGGVAPCLPMVRSRKNSETDARSESGSEHGEEEESKQSLAAEIGGGFGDAAEMFMSYASASPQHTEESPTQTDLSLTYTFTPSPSRREAHEFDLLVSQVDIIKVSAGEIPQKADVQTQTHAPILEPTLRFIQTDISPPLAKKSTISDAQTDTQGLSAAAATTPSEKSRERTEFDPLKSFFVLVYYRAKSLIDSTIGGDELQGVRQAVDRELRRTVRTTDKGRIAVLPLGGLGQRNSV